MTESCPAPPSTMPPVFTALQSGLCRPRSRLLHLLVGFPFIQWTVLTDSYPAWARDEPPSPTSRLTPPLDNSQANPRPSDAASLHSVLSQGESRWWTFTRRGLRDFLPSSASLQPPSFYRKTDREKGTEPPSVVDRLNIPHPALQLTQHQANSPGWDTPWTSRLNAQGPHRKRDAEAAYFDSSPPSDEERLSLSTTRRKKVRRFILINPYVPLVSFAFTLALSEAHRFQSCFV